jgi:hypothetical protein
VVDVDGGGTGCGLSGERSKRFVLFYLFIHASATHTLYEYVRPFASFPSPELTCCSLMVVEKRRTVELRRDRWTIRRRPAVRSLSLGRWLDAKGRQPLGEGVGADFAGTTHVAVGESWSGAGACE